MKKILRALFIYFITGVKIHTIGSNCKIKINSCNATVGEHVNFGDFCWIESVSTYQNEKFSPQLIIESKCDFSDAVHISCVDKIIIKSGCLFGSRIYVGDNSHGEYSGISSADYLNIPPGKRNLGDINEIIVGRNCWIGDGVIITAGVHIGECSIIGANAVVSHNIPERSIAVGIPARVIKHWNEQSNKWENINDKS